MSTQPTRPRVVVVGGGFGGIQAALKLSRMPVDVTLIDRRNFHLLLAEVHDVDLDARRVMLRPVVGEVVPESIGYDTLIVSGGSEYSYFGHDEWREPAAELKSLEGALTLRNRILGAFEAAELEPDPARREEWLTFAVVGAGPTGVEMAGQIGEIARGVRNDFREIDPSSAKILLIEAADRVLGGFPPSLSAKAARSLERLGVTVRVNAAVVELDHDAVTVKPTEGEPERIPTRTVVWAAGVVASELAGMLARRAGHGTDRAGRVEVLEDLTLPGYPDVLPIGDMIHIRQADGSDLVLPGVAPVAMQQGRHAARVVRDRLRGRQARPFRYLDKGNLATIGRAAAVADVKGVHLSGFIAWVTWLIVHLWYLIGFQNRLLVLIRWAFSFVLRGTRGARLITFQGSE
jgi:NADH dehydrogenase